MKKHLRTLIVGLTLIAVTNAVALIGVNYNRSGDTDAELALTERELKLPYSYGFLEENSGIALNIKWRVGYTAPYNPDYYDHWELVPWLSKDKLEELGFKLNEPLTNQDARRRYKKMLPREVYLVLEYDGDVHKQVIGKRKSELAKQQELLANNPEKEEFKERVKRVQNQLEAEERFNSRLFVIDADLNKTVLRGRYPDRSRYLIMMGQVDITIDEKDGAYLLKGHISGLNIVTVNIPFVYHSMLEPLMTSDSYRKQQINPRYSVKLATGQRLEPWVRDVSLLK